VELQGFTAMVSLLTSAEPRRSMSFFSKASRRDPHAFLQSLTAAVSWGGGWILRNTLHPSSKSVIIRAWCLYHGQVHDKSSHCLDLHRRQLELRPARISSDASIILKLYWCSGRSGAGMMCMNQEFLKIGTPTFLKMLVM